MMRRPSKNLMRHTDTYPADNACADGMAYNTHKDSSGPGHALTQLIHVPRIPTRKLIPQRA